MLIIASVFAYGGAIALMLGYFGILFCGFGEGIGRGLLVLLFPFLGFADAIRRYRYLIWLWAGGLGGLVVGALLRP